MLHVPSRGLYVCTATPPDTRGALTYPRHSPHSTGDLAREDVRLGRSEASARLGDCVDSLPALVPQLVQKAPPRRHGRDALRAHQFCTPVLGSNFGMGWPVFLSNFAPNGKPEGAMPEGAAWTAGTGR